MAALCAQVHFISVMGNARANVFWEARLPDGYQRPREGDMRQLSTYINAKCARRLGRRNLNRVPASVAHRSGCFCFGSTPFNAECLARRTGFT